MSIMSPPAGSSPHGARLPGRTARDFAVVPTCAMVLRLSPKDHINRTLLRGFSRVGVPGCTSTLWLRLLLLPSLFFPPLSTWRYQPGSSCWGLPACGYGAAGPDSWPWSAGQLSAQAGHRPRSALRLPPSDPGATKAVLGQLWRASGPGRHHCGGEVGAGT